MKILVIGRAAVGKGLVRLWRTAGHEVTEVGREGGDASDADVVLLAVPSNQISVALRGVRGIEGKPVIDATNAYAGRDEAFPSLAAEVKSITGGPLVKAFNVTFAEIYDKVREQRVRPSCLYCGDDEARELGEQLIRDAGFEPVSAGGLEHARTLEEQLPLLFAVSNAGLGPWFYRIAKPGEL